MINRMYMFIAVAALASALSPAGARMTASDMAPWVYPANRPATPSTVTFMPDGESYCRLSDDCRRVERYDIRSGEIADTLFNVERSRETRLVAVEGFIISPDASRLIVWTDSRSIYRRSTSAAYYVYDTHSRILSPLSRRHDRQRSPLFSPDSRMVAFTADDNNIHIAKLDYKSEVDVTTDGATGKIINGVPDWVYEEEFSTTCSMAWAPDNLNLCFLKYDETDVPLYSMMRYDNPENPAYPTVWSYKYPVAGEPNSRVTLHSYDVETRKTKDIALPEKSIEYIPRLAYGPDPETLVVSTLNREQNRCWIYRVNPKSTVAREIYTEESSSWILPATYEDLAVESERLVITSWRDGFARLYIYNYNGVQIAAPVTGDCDVTAYYGTDTKGNIYYQVAAPTPMDRTVRCIDAKGRVTDVSPASGNSSARFVPGMRYALMSHDTPDTPPVWSFVTAGGKQLRVVEDNASYAAIAKAIHAPREFFTMSSGGVTLNGYIVTPRDFKRSGKYPVIMYQYSGPESQEVLHRWQLDWMDAFASRGYVVVCVDGRGTGGRGRSFCDIVYKRLGHYETIDQLAAADYAARLPYADPERIAIYGWSYGGYESLMCATAPGNRYKAAVAIAPVTSWRLYDTVYAERFMQTPGQNDDGYTLSAPLERADALSCPLLMMYGTSDDNVHPANTLDFVSALGADGNFCDMFVFPDMNHSINFGNARAVVYCKMLDWLDKNL